MIPLGSVVKERKMTKITKKIIIGTAIVLIALFLFLGIYVQGRVLDNSFLLDYNVRKEDLITKQEQLSVMINDLNKSLQTEILKQNSLSNQLADLTGKPVNTASSNTPSQPAIKPTPKPAPVTSAS